MRSMVFASRTNKEVVRDPLTMIFGIGFPVIVMLLLSAIQANVPVDIFKIDKLTPGIAVFGLSFISLFSGMLLAKDRCTSFLLRLFASPLSAWDYIIGYALPMLPMSLGQIAICYIVGFFLGLQFTANVLLSILVLVPAALLFIAIGLLAGSIFNDKQVGPLCGALLTNLCAWLSGAWFDLDLVGGGFKTVASLLPFYHAVESGKAAIYGNYASIMPHMVWVIGYAAVTFFFAVLVFRHKMNSDN